MMLGEYGGLAEDLLKSRQPTINPNYLKLTGSAGRDRIGVTAGRSGALVPATTKYETSI